MRRFLVIAALVLGLPGLAHAQSGGMANGWYLELAAGANFADDMTYCFNDTVCGVPQDLDLDSGLYAGVRLGKRIGNPFRAELELGYRTNDAENDAIVGLVGGSPDMGSIDALNIMVNGIADLPLSDGFSLYGGAGIGAVMVEADVKSSFADCGVNRTERDWGLGVQGILGAAFAVSPSVELILDYRLLHSPNVLIRNFCGGFDDHIDDDYTAHTLSIGIRIPL